MAPMAGETLGPQKSTDYPKGFFEKLNELLKSGGNKVLIQDFRIWASGRENFDHLTALKRKNYPGWEPEHFQEALRSLEENARGKISQVRAGFINLQTGLDAAHKEILAEMDESENNFEVQKRRQAVYAAVQLLMNELDSAEKHQHARLEKEFQETFGTGGN